MQLPCLLLAVLIMVCFTTLPSDRDKKKKSKEEGGEDEGGEPADGAAAEGSGADEQEDEESDDGVSAAAASDNLFPVGRLLCCIPI